MSKKNSKQARRDAHAHDIQREKELQAKKKEQQEKKQHKQEVAAKATGVQDGKVTKRKGMRIRKGVVIKGVKVTDADSKRKVRKLLQAETLAKLMEVEDAVPKNHAGRITTKALKDLKAKKRATIKMKKTSAMTGKAGSSAKKSSKAKQSSGAGAGPEAMAE